MNRFLFCLLFFGHVELVLFVQSFLLNFPPSRSQMQLWCQQQQGSTSTPQVLYESERILAICKPEGVSHHDDDLEGSGIVSLIRRYQACGEIDYQGRIYGVHRLDRVTSGILLFAKDQSTAGILSSKFREGEISKCYIGISTKKPTKKKQGWIQGNMVQGRRKSWFLTRDSEVDSNNYAKTRFFTSGLSLLDDHLINSNIQPKTLILFLPHTGRTHQLRVAAKSVGLPLLGDPVYKDGTGVAIEVQRTYLHSCALHLELDAEEIVTIWSPPSFGNLWDSSGMEMFDHRVRQLVRMKCNCLAIESAISCVDPGRITS